MLVASVTLIDNYIPAKHSSFSQGDHNDDEEHKIIWNS
jgi:hypothetical protein